MCAAETRSGTGRCWPGRLARALAWLLLVLVLLAGIGWCAARPDSPDAFYDPPARMPPAPGRLLRSEPFTRAVPDGMRGWRILYTTTRTDNSPAVASAIVLVPAAPMAGPRPVVAWAHGTVGVARGCAPSLAAQPWANVPATDRLAAEGWTFVATDYPGMGTAGGHAYLVGDDAARAVLDSVRAARLVPGVVLDRRTVVWGHSQGGHSALWTGMRARTYAPDVPLAGVAAMAPASDLPGLIPSIRGDTFGKLIAAYLLDAYARVYPDVRAEDYAGWFPRLLARDIAGRCNIDRRALFSVLETMLLPGDGMFSRPPTEGPLGRRLAENVPDGPIAAPLLIAQGAADPLVKPDIQRAYAARRCAAGQPLDYRAYAGRDHLSVVAQDSPMIADLLNWTRGRLAGLPPVNACPNLR